VILLGLASMSGCASAPWRIADHRVAPAEWAAIIECVTMSARASGRDPFVEEARVQVPFWTRRGVQEDILFVLVPYGNSEYTVRSKIAIQDVRNGKGQPMQGASQETRRLQQQLDQQCLTAYPILEGTERRQTGASGSASPR
jgi:hypothetical protein